MCADALPDVAMSRLKELNFFNGPEVAPHDDAGSWWRTGQWHRGLDWYAAQFDPGSQYLARSRYHERLAPYLGLFDREQILVVVQERLLHRRDREIARLYAHAGVDPDRRHQRHGERVHVGAPDAVPPAADVASLRDAVLERVGDDVERPTCPGRLCSGSSPAERSSAARPTSPRAASTTWCSSWARRSGSPSTSGPPAGG